MTNRARPLPPIEWLNFIARMTYITLRRRQLNRETENVVAEYTAGWKSYEAPMQAATNLNDWLWIKDLDDAPAYANVKGRVSFGGFDSGAYYRNAFLAALRRHFPKARSVTEFGCGPGRNLLFLKRELPDLECYGYELCQPGVDVARAAAEKFSYDVKYAQLDYVKDGPEKFVFPETDVAFTMFSLEQLPRTNAVAVRNILDHVRLGTIHIEPVPENYPWSLRGLLGRIEHRKVDYLSGFDDAVRNLGLADVYVERLTSAHNPLMSPSLYVLKKR